MDDEEAAFRRAIRRSPDDDLPRLVYADWLDERRRDGDAERAMFIRIQLHRAANGEDEPWPIEDELLRTYARDWCEQDLGTRPPALGFHSRRGFVAAVTASQTEFEQHAGAWMTNGRIESLTICGPCDTAQIASHPIASGFTELVLAGCHARDHDLAVLAASAWTQKLRVLDLGFNGITSYGLESLLRQPGGWPCLTELSLSGNPLRAQGARCIAGSDLLPALATLRMDRCQIGVAGARSLANAQGLPSLKRLSVSDNALHYLSVLLLLRSPHLPSLEEVECLFHGRDLISRRTVTQARTACD